MNAATKPALSRRLLGHGALLAVGFGLLMYVALEETLSRATEARALQRGEILLHSLLSVVSTTDDPRDLARMVSAMSAEADVLTITVTAGPRIVAASELSLIDTSASALPAHAWNVIRRLSATTGGRCEMHGQAAHVECAARLDVPGAEDGIVYLRSDTARIRARHVALLWQIFGWVGGLLVALLASLFALIERQVVRPVQGLTRAAALPDFRLGLGSLETIDSREIALLAAALTRAADTQREIRQRLEETVTRFDLAIDGAAEVIWDVDLAADRCYFAPRMADLLGLAVADLPTDAASFDALVHPDDLARFKATVISHVRDRQPYAAEYRLRHADGSYRWVASRGQAIWSVSGRAARIAGSLRDVTAERAARAAIDLLNARLATLIENLPGIVFEFRPGQDGAATFETTSTQIEQIFGLRAGLGMQSYEMLISRVHEADRDALFASITEAVTSRRPWQCEFRACHPDGTITWLEGRSSPRTTADGTLVYTGIMLDVSARKSAEAQAREGEAMLAGVLEGARAVAFRCRVDADWSVVYMSDGIERIAGYRAEEFLGPAPRRFIDLMHPDDLATALARVESALAHDAAWEIEYRLRCADGSLRWIAARGTLVRDAEGVVTHVDGTLFDIHALKETELALRDSETRFQLIVQGGDLGTWEWDIPAGVLLVNARWCEFRSLPPVTRVPLDAAWSIVHPDDRANVQRALDAHTAGSEALYEAQYRVRNPRGGWRWMIDRGRIVARDAQGKPLRLVGTNRDISARKEAEARARDAQALLRTVLDLLPQRVFWKDRNGRYLGSNRAFAEDHGYDKVTGLTLHDLGYDPRTVEQYDQSDRRMLETGIAELDRVVRHVRPDGTVEWISYSKAPLRNEAGEIVGITGTYLDVTTFKETEFALIAARDTAEAANRAKSDFLSNMSHEIRTPLNGVLGCTELLRGGVTLEQVELVDTILNCGRSLLTLLNDILDFSKIEAGSLHLEQLLLPPRELCAEVVELMAPRAQDKGLDLTLVCRPEAPPVIASDPTRLKQVLGNLLGNAIKFTAEGEVVVELGVTPEGGLHVAVRDTGIGIAPARQQAIFERFTQADGSTTRRYGGTGLGLAISQRLVEALGGRIGVDSAPGQGATFWFTLPRGTELVPEDQPPPLLPVKRALVLSSSAARRLALGFDLDGLGLEIRSAANAADAATALGGFAAEVLFVDLAWPDDDATARVRALCAAHSGLHVVALCTQAALNSLDRARFDAVLTLPVTRLPRLIDALSQAGGGTASIPTRAALA